MAAAGMALFPSYVFSGLLQTGKGETLVPWTDPPPAAPNADMNLLNWEDVDTWITPVDKFFKASHYGVPVVDASTYRLEIGGLVRRPRAYTLDALKALSQQTVDFTLECSGNRGFPWFVGGVFNARWAGAPLAPILEEAGVLDHGIEVVFYGSDTSEETVKPTGRPEVAMNQHFARSMSVADAMAPKDPG